MSSMMFNCEKEVKGKIKKGYVKHAYNFFQGRSRNIANVVEEVAI